MPPRPSSRSSTYLPKTWGNTARHLSALLGPLVWFGSVLLGCGQEPPDEPRALHAHYPDRCKPDSDSSGSRAIELRALGDFDPGNTTVAFVGESDRDRVLSIPDQTRVVELRTVGPDPHWGVATVVEDSETNVALWPVQQPCTVLTADVTDNSPALGVTLGVNSHWLAAIGTSDSQSSARGVRLIDLGDGNEVELGSAEMTRSRSFASLTAVDAGLLAAGGEDVEQGTVHDDAEFFDLSTQRFQGNASVIALRHARTRHAALQLDASAVVLIGGADATGQPVRELERVSSTDAQARDLAQLGAGRIEPTALRLSDERIVVAGGYAIGSGSQPVPIGIVEWFNADATRQVGTLNLEDAALGRAFQATAAGGVLAVGGCDADDQPSPAVWWIDAEQQASRLPDLPPAAQSCHPHLALASLGAPFLFSNARLWRFDPWTGEFRTGEIDLEQTAQSPSRVVSVDPGLLFWLDEAERATSLVALRHDTRNSYSADVTPFLVTDDTRLIPDRPANANARYTEELELELAGDATVWIADTEYLDFTLELTLANDDASAPLVMVGSQAVGDSSCRWPRAGNDRVFQLQRRGTQITLIGASERTCSIPSASRVPVGLRANGATTQIARIAITRGTPQ